MRRPARHTAVVSRRIGWAAAWVVAVVVAVSVGLAAISTVGATIRGRGPLGNEIIRTDELDSRSLRPDPAAPRLRDVVTGEFGSFTVECQGVVAYGVTTDPAVREGWRVISYEQGPDDDVDAVFSDGSRSVDLEVFCNRGRPTVAEMEYNTLPGSGSDAP